MLPSASTRPSWRTEDAFGDQSHEDHIVLDDDRVIAGERDQQFGRALGLSEESFPRPGLRRPGEARAPASLTTVAVCDAFRLPSIAPRSQWVPSTLSMPRVGPRQAPQAPLPERFIALQGQLEVVEDREKFEDAPLWKTAGRCLPEQFQVPVSKSRTQTRRCRYEAWSCL